MTGEPVAELTPRPPAPSRADVDAEWAAWRERVRATYEAVEYTCAHRLADPSLAGAVAVQVVAGLVARPQIFRYFGLPFSGRIAKLAEARLAEAAAGELASVCAWAQLRERLDAVPGAHRDALVVTCVQGENVNALAAMWNCDNATAETGHAAMLAFMREVAGPGLASTSTDD